MFLATSKALGSDAAILILLATTTAGVSTHSSAKLEPGAVAIAYAPSKDDARPRDGDLVFRRSRSMFSRALPFVLHERTRYSHVGIITMQASEAYVAHMLPAGHGRCSGSWLEPLSSFVASSQASRADIYRLRQGSELFGAGAARAAVRLVAEHRPFDSRFNRLTGDSLYCTELAWLAYREAGLEIVRAEDMVSCQFVRQKVISPEALLKSGRFRLVKRLR